MLRAGFDGWTQCPSNEITADADTDLTATTTISGVFFARGARGLEIFVKGADLHVDRLADVVDMGDFAIGLGSTCPAALTAAAS